MTSSWNNKEENPIRVAIWHAGTTISDILSGFLAAGILEHMGNTGGLHAWQWFFIVEGAVSIIIAIAGLFRIPDWPHGTKLLIEEEREMAQCRVLVPNSGRDDNLGRT